MSGLAGQFCLLERALSKPHEFASWGRYLRLNEATPSIDLKLGNWIKGVLSDVM